MPQRPPIPTVGHTDTPSQRTDATRKPTTVDPLSAVPRETVDPPEPAVRARGSTGLPAARAPTSPPIRATSPALRATTPPPARSSTRPPTRTTLGTNPGPAEEKLRALIYAAEPHRAKWVEAELSRAPVTIQMARKVRTVVAALLKDPPPRPELLIVDFDAVTPGELFELHAIRHESWTGRIIGLGAVPRELVLSLTIEHVFPSPLVRDSLLDYIAGTRHAAVTVAVPVVPPRNDD